MSEVGGWVSNSFGARGIGSDVGTGQAAAQAVANNAISLVDGILGTLQNEGSGALSDVTSAIGALGSFKPGEIGFSYQIPGYVAASYSLPGGFQSGSSGTAPTMPETGSFSFPITKVIPDAITATAPESVEMQEFAAPSITSFGEPTAPKTSDVTIPGAPEYAPPDAPAAFTALPPALKTLVAPIFDAKDITPYIADTALPELPELPEIARSQSADAYKPLISLADMAAQRATEALERPVLFSPRLTGREQYMAAEAWAARGIELGDDVMQAQLAYRSDTTRLMAAGEKSRMQTDVFLFYRDWLWQEIGLKAEEFKKYTGELGVLLVLKTMFDRDMFGVGALVDTYKMAVALYNGLVAEFRKEATLYKIGLEAELGALTQWKNEMDAEMAKTKLNSQLAQNFAAATQAETSKTAMYDAAVQGLMANVSAYRSRMEAFATQAEVARTTLDVYKGTVDAYTAGLTQYKAQFQTFVAQTRSVVAQNQLEEAKTKISIADMQAAGADAQSKIIEMEMDSLALKLEARQKGAETENVKLKNAIESLKAQIDGDIGRKKAIEWGANVQLTDVQNDAIAAEGQAAARYYNAASDSSYRASEQAFRAMMASAQAANIAQEGAGRSAASVAQGAYSAVHVSANLQGSGRVTGDEDRRATQNSQISDWLDYDESRQQILSA